MTVQEIYLTDSRAPLFTVCLKCLRALSMARDIFPESLTISKAIEIVQDTKSPFLIPAHGGSSAVSGYIEKA